jgi:hypothetical protein
VSLPAFSTSNAVEAASVELERIRTLQGRIKQMQKTTLSSRGLSTLGALAPLLPGGALQAGAAYSIAGSSTLLMALLAEPSRSGVWCGVVGVPEFGVEAAARFGVDLERLVLIPQPAAQWLSVTATLVDAIQLVVTRPPVAVTDADAARLGARLRGRGATLIVLGDWPRSEAKLTVSESSWSGVGRGHGYLSERSLTVASDSRGVARTRRIRLRLREDAETTTLEAADWTSGLNSADRPVHGHTTPIQLTLAPREAARLETAQLEAVG